MKRTICWSLGSVLLASGALAFAQQEGGGSRAGAAPDPVAGGATSPESLSPTPPPGSADPFAGTTTMVYGPRGGAMTPGGGPARMTRNFEPTQDEPFFDGVRADGGSKFQGLEATAPGAAGGPPAFSRGSRFGSTQMYSGDSRRVVSKEAQEFREAESACHQVAQRLRQLPEDHAEAPKLKEELKAAVTKAFDARQAMQQAELKRLKEKLAEIETTVTRREKLKEQLIEDRIYEMTSGDVLSGSLHGFGEPMINIFK